jgi:hypothetical protein
MALVRGMVYKSYMCDDGTTKFQTLVDADEAAIAARGWAAAVVGGDLIPRGFKERRAHGISADTGRRGSCRVGSTAADLWTGGATTFTVEADDNTVDTMTVTSRTGERRRLAH